MIQVVLYSREDCHLCEQALQDLDSIRTGIPFELVILDVDQEPELHSKFGFNVPVIDAGPYRIKAPFSQEAIRATIIAAMEQNAQSNEKSRTPVDPTLNNSSSWTKADSFTQFFSRHYMAFFNLAVLIYLGLAFLAPILMKSGFERPADAIYKVYSFVCHQLAFRSFYLYGEQAYYPREIVASDSQLSYSQATGLGESNSAIDILVARNFIGDEHVGFKIALCERDVAMYSGILAFGMLFALTGRKIKSIPWYIWLIFGIGPLALDGFSQLFSQPPLSFIPFRESTAFLRVLTGFMFGFFTAWFGYPLVEESLRDTHTIIKDRKEKILAET